MSAVAIVAALIEELAPLARRLQGRRAFRLGGRRGAEGEISGRRVTLLVTGDGAARASEGVEELLASRPFDALLAVGVAAGASPDLPAGALVAAEEVRGGDQPLPRPDARLLAAALQLPGVVRGTVLSVRELLTTPSDKAAAGRAAGASVVAADLETASYAGAAAARRLPYLALRAISDPQEEGLPAFLRGCQRADGSIDRGRVAMVAVAAPWHLPPLLRLAGRVRGCAASLADAVEGLLRALPPEGKTP